ncbi:HNH endonuclease [Henriciella aquimarina]|uniref:HNH endonuclease n=1 Tax=Henriciella aquimarina TaxID=545261 RepID=UPI000A06DC57|nr:HNH endonuclease [Henriciella aquimarina]
MATQRLCSVSDCGNTHYCRGFCRAHYSRFKRYGDPLAGRIPTGSTVAWLEQHADHEGDACLPWPFATAKNGYAKIRIDGTDTWAHRVMCRMAHGEPPTPRHHAAHSCGNGNEACCNPNHLRWATPKENFRDMLKHGTYPRGEKSGNSKLTEADVRRIRSSSKSGAALARELGVSRKLISLIRRRQAWKHVA